VSRGRRLIFPRRIGKKKRKKEGSLGEKERVLIVKTYSWEAKRISTQKPIIEIKPKK